MLFVGANLQFICQGNSWQNQQSRQSYPEGTDGSLLSCSEWAVAWLELSLAPGGCVCRENRKPVSRLPNVTESGEDNKKTVNCIGCFLIYNVWFLFSPSAGPGSKPARGVQLSDQRLAELGQTPHRKRRDPHLQAVLHRQKCRQRTGRLEPSVALLRAALIKWRQDDTTVNLEQTRFLVFK